MNELRASKIQESPVCSPSLDSGRPHSFSRYIKLEEAETLTNYQMSNASLKIIDWTKSIPAPDKYDYQFQGYAVLPVGLEFHDDDNIRQIPAYHVISTSSFDRTKLLFENIAPDRDTDWDRFWLYQVIRLLRRAEEQRVADRIEYLTSEENVEDGGDIPKTASIASFVSLYLDNTYLGQPCLGTTPNGYLQALWEFSDRRRLIAEFLDDDMVKYIYRRAGNISSSKPFIMGQLPRHEIRGILENVSI